LYLSLPPIEIISKSLKQNGSVKKNSEEK